MTLKGLAGTYAIFPAGQVPPMGDVADHASRIVADSFAVAIAMTAPFLVYGIVFAVMLGLLARLMPTLQVFFIAMPMQLLAGLALMAVALTSMMLYFLSSYEERMSVFLGGS
jgi:flagellar biosynthetic protein FliR